MDKSIGEYFNLYRKLAYNNKKNIRVAYLSSFTSKAIKEVLTVKCDEDKINCEYYEGEYNQYSQEILNINSNLYKFKPDLIIIFIDTRNLLGKYYFEMYDLDKEKRKAFILEKFIELNNLINILKNNTKSKILLHNFEVPSNSPMGILENKQEFGLVEGIEKLNLKISEEYRKDSRVFVFNYDSFCSKLGKDNIHDYKMYYIADLRLKLELIPRLCEEYMCYIRAISSIIRKCLVLDLDNTLWGGIVGEVGIENLKLGPTSEGRPFMELQNYLLSLNKRGVLLAVNSKNNRDEAMKVIREHPYMLLREKNFAYIEINWQDKAENIRKIAKELNIGLDSIVFMDDDKLNSEFVKSELPEVKVVDLPKDPAMYVKTAMELNCFNIMQLTDEDLKKQNMYLEQKKRNFEKQSSSNILEYIKKLNIVIDIKENDKFNVPRISQLSQKTNQFNMTTIRYSEEEIKALMDRKDYTVISAKVSDKFGDSGLTSVMIVKENADIYDVQAFLMSCRIIGRRIEYSLMDYLIKKAKKHKIKEVAARFIETSKNIPSKNFYKDYGFEFEGERNNTEYWKYDL